MQKRERGGTALSSGARAERRSSCRTRVPLCSHSLPSGNKLRQLAALAPTGQAEEPAPARTGLQSRRWFAPHSARAASLPPSAPRLTPRLTVGRGGEVPLPSHGAVFRACGAWSPGSTPPAAQRALCCCDGMRGRLGGSSSQAPAGFPFFSLSLSAASPASTAPKSDPHLSLLRSQRRCEGGV